MPENWYYMTCEIQKYTFVHGGHKKYLVVLFSVANSLRFLKVASHFCQVSTIFKRRKSLSYSETSA